MSRNKKTKEQIELARMQEEQDRLKLQAYLSTGHTMPKTRREFLGAGLIGSMAFIALPSVFQLLAQSAAAADLSPECSKILDPQKGWIPYINIALQGGAALHYNTLVLDKGRQPLTSYSRLGLGETASFSVRNEFGNVPLAVGADGTLISPLMKALFESAGLSATDKTALVKYCVRSQDDASSNIDSIMGLVNAAGLLGTHLPNLAAAGGRAFNPSAVIPSQPLQPVNTVSSLGAALALQGNLKSSLTNTAHRDALLNIVQRLNSSQRKRFIASENGQVLGKMADCSSSKVSSMKDFDPAQLDPRSNADVAGAWGITATSAENNTDVVHAMIAMNVLNGKSGAAKYFLGGYDYHGQTRDQQNTKDMEAGRLIGRILKTAELMNSPVFIHVTSDGSVEGATPDVASNFTGDAGSRGSGFFVSYDPKGRPATSDNQIGQFNSSQAVDEAFISTWTVERAAVSVFANYLALHKKMDLFEKMAPNQFTTADLNKLVKIA